MKNLVLSLAQVLSKIIFYILVFGVLILLFFLWKAVILEGQLNISPERVTIRIFNQELSPDQRDVLLHWLNQNRLAASLTTLALTIILPIFLLPFFWIQQVINSLTLNNWFVEENTSRLKKLGFYFIGMTILGLLFKFSLSLILDSLNLDFSFYLIYWSILFFLLSYMNQQGVQLSKEAELTV